jgi:hypothetical protein
MDAYCLMLTRDICYMSVCRPKRLLYPAVLSCEYYFYTFHSPPECVFKSRMHGIILSHVALYLYL